MSVAQVAHKRHTKYPGTHGKRMHMRIGDGGLTDPEAVKCEARGLYLLAIAGEAPSVLQELARGALPLYKQMYLLTRRDDTVSDLRLHDWISLSKLSSRHNHA